MSLLGGNKLGNDSWLGWCAAIRINQQTVAELGNNSDGLQHLAAII